MFSRNVEERPLTGPQRRSVVTSSSSSAAAATMHRGSDQSPDDHDDNTGAAVSTEPFSGLFPEWLRLPPSWGIWWFVGVMVSRMVLWIFVLGYLMQQRDISAVWSRDQFFWAILVSLAIEYPLYVTLAARSRAQEGVEADVVAARFQGQIVAHIFAFVAFFRTDTALFARSESGYCAVALIILLDALCVKILRRLF